MKYIREENVVDIQLLTFEDLDAIGRLMPKIFEEIIKYDPEVKRSYIIKDGRGIKIINKFILDMEYTKL